MRSAKIIPGKEAQVYFCRRNLATFENILSLLTPSLLRGSYLDILMSWRSDSNSSCITRAIVHIMHDTDLSRCANYLGDNRVEEIVLSHPSKGIFGLEGKSRISKDWLFGCQSSRKICH